MKLRAAVFDLYGTLLRVGPPPPDAEERWQTAWASLGSVPRLTLPAFEQACRAAIAVEHAAAQRRGIKFPEVFWPEIVNTVVPELAEIPAGSAAAVPFHGADFLHTVTLAPGAAEALRAARDAGMRLGLASNCQPYSLAEVDRALKAEGLSADIFDRGIRFLSFENGFSKPDPHVFHLLTARLRLLGIAANETLMVGDREDNDLAPARACGWPVFDIGAASAERWSQLRDRLLQS